jgi:hypothetical protein
MEKVSIVGVCRKRQRERGMSMSMSRGRLGVRPTSPWAWATPLRGNQMTKKIKKLIVYIEFYFIIIIIIHKIKY